MNKNSNSIQNRYYRRGLVLGFTMAEIMILTLFAILMALAASLLSKQAKLNKLISLSGIDSLKVAILVDTVQKTFPNAENIDGQIKEITFVAQRAKDLEAVKKELEKLQEELLALREIKEIIKKVNKDNIQDIDFQKYVLLGREVKEFADNHKPSIPVSDIKSTINEILTNKDMASKLRVLSKENETLKGQLINISERLGGKGTEYPPCWATSTGKPEYIFDVALKSTGFIIRDRKIPHRADEQSHLPVFNISYDSEISSGEFTKQTEPLLNWSKANNCRFFVHVFDQTGSHEKDTYKLQERVIQQSFYTYEVLNNRF